ncbi:MAG: hypothetical protein HY431_01470 [Candidatus Levybacteria bacterium]|nr:hypothetical protein [Candidatus Levybacteria bacterium]
MAKLEHDHRDLYPRFGRQQGYADLYNLPPHKRIGIDAPTVLTCSATALGGGLIFLGTKYDVNFVKEVGVVVFMSGSLRFIVRAKERSERKD